MRITTKTRRKLFQVASCPLHLGIKNLFHSIRETIQYLGLYSIFATKFIYDEKDNNSIGICGDGIRILQQPANQTKQ